MEKSFEKISFQNFKQNLILIQIDINSMFEHSGNKFWNSLNQTSAQVVSPIYPRYQDMFYV